MCWLEDKGLSFERPVSVSHCKMTDPDMSWLCAILWRLPQIPVTGCCTTPHSAPPRPAKCWQTYFEEPLDSAGWVFPQAFMAQNEKRFEDTVFWGFGGSCGKSQEVLPYCRVVTHMGSVPDTALASKVCGLCRPKACAYSEYKSCFVTWMSAGGKKKSSQ